MSIINNVMDVAQKGISITYNIKKENNSIGYIANLKYINARNSFATSECMQSLESALKWGVDYANGLFQETKGKGRVFGERVYE